MQGGWDAEWLGLASGGRAVLGKGWLRWKGGWGGVRGAPQSGEDHDLSPPSKQENASSPSGKKQKTEKMESSA